MFLCFLAFYQFPYYINAPGGAINVTERIEIDGATESAGSFNMAYVRELPGTLAMMAIATIHPKWDISKEAEHLFGDETVAESAIRNKLLLDEAQQDAIILAYRKAGIDVEIKSSKMIVTLIDSKASTGLKIGDVILTVNGIKVSSINDVRTILKDKKVGDRIPVKGLRSDKTINEEAIIYEEDRKMYIGIGVSLMREVLMDPEINFNNKKSESGPSGGLITSLTIYDALTDKDLTSGLKIIGTGTIDIDGNVGAIGGVKYKLAGAVRQKADIFFVPAGENYNEAKKLVEKYKYNIELVSIKTFDDALEYLLNI